MEFSDYFNNSISSTYNGRVDISKPSKLDIPAYQTKEIDNKTFYAEAVQGHTKPNEVSNLFFSEKNINFSEKNINALQDGIRYRIFNETGVTIGRQSDNDLKIIMRSIYLQYSKNLPTKVIEQVRELNKKVLDWSVKEVLSNLKQFQKYKKDVSTMPIPLERSPLITTKGTKTLELKPWI
jgi:hypothetical protein